MPGTWIHKVVGNCRIDQKIGEGGCGQVFRGVDLMLERPVAIKVLHPALAARSDVNRRFRSEAHALARLAHPNVATLYSLLREGDAYLMVMEFVEGETLEARLRREGPLALEEALPLLLQAFDGIEHAHELGVVHRDLKSSNLMVGADGRLKVMDFGVARVVGRDGLTHADQPIGTPEYMSPEQVRGEEIDARSDIYSLGVLIYKLLSGSLPITGPSPFEVMRAQVDREPRPLREAAPDAPECVADAVARALRKDPAERFASVGALRDTLLEAPAAAALAPARRPRARPPVAGLEPTALIPVATPGWRRGLRRAALTAALASLCLGVGWHGERAGVPPAEAVAGPDPFVPVAAVAPPPTPAWASAHLADVVEGREAEPPAVLAAARAVPEPLSLADPPAAPSTAETLPAPPERDAGWVIRR